MRVKKILQVVMLLSVGISVINLFVLYFFPSAYLSSIISPIANLTIFKLAFAAIAENKYGYIIFVCVLIILILVGAAAVRKDRILLSVLSFAVYLGDLVYAALLFAADMQNGFINTLVVLPCIIDIISIVLFILYLLQTELLM